jgi:hypothetical protein
VGDCYECGGISRHREGCSREYQNNRPLPTEKVYVRVWKEVGSDETERHFFLADAEKEEYVFGYNPKRVPRAHVLKLIEELGLTIVKGNER